MLQIQKLLPNLYNYLKEKQLKDIKAPEGRYVDGPLHEVGWPVEASLWFLYYYLTMCTMLFML